MINRQTIVAAYTTIRKTNNTIPDEVLDFMFEAALEKYNQLQEEIHLVNGKYDQLKETQNCLAYMRETLKNVLSGIPVRDCDETIAWAEHLLNK